MRNRPSGNGTGLHSAILDRLSREFVCTWGGGTMQPETLAPVFTGSSPEELILRNFAAAIGRRRYEHWFHQKTCFRVEGDELVVSVNNPFLVTWLPQNFRRALVAAAQPVIGLSAGVRFEVSSDVDAVGTDADGSLALQPRVSQETHTTAEPVATSVVARLSGVSQFDTLSPRPGTPGRGAGGEGTSCDLHASLPPARTADPIFKRLGRDDSETLRSDEPFALHAVLKLRPVTESGRNATTKGVIDADRSREISAPAVLRIKKDPQLSLAPVKPVTETAARHARRYADLMEFVAGSCNEFALSAARQVCLAPGEQFTTLFVHGPVGVGKTHVLEGICREVKSRFKNRQVVYLTAEAFANYFTQALREHKVPGFRQRFRSVDVLIVDDIDFLVGKPGIQEEFLFTLQQLEAHGKQVVVSAHGHPRLLTKLSDELRTRFLAGMVCRIDAPDAQTRLRILESKSQRHSVEFSAEILQFIADKFKNNVRELEGAFNTLCAYQRMQGRRLSLSAARQVLADLERDCIRVVRLADIEQAVCSLFGVTLDDLKSAKRQKSLSQPRMLAMYLARKHTRSAYSEIGEYFGGRNHSTVMAAERKIVASLKAEESVRIHTQTWRVNDLVEALEKQLQAG